MFNRTIELNVVKKQKKDEDPDPTLKDVLDEIASRDRHEAVKALANTVGLQIVKWIAITTAISTAAKIAENRLSK